MMLLNILKINNKKSGFKATFLYLISMHINKNYEFYKKVCN